MLYIDRKLPLADQAKKKSVFLFGPRQTGKTSLISHTISDAKIVNLLKQDTFLYLSQDPSRIRKDLRNETKTLVVDEVQKLPVLLNEIQVLIDEHDLKCILTGSSARRLRRGGVNLLGGRARSLFLHPFVFAELGDRFNLIKALEYGMIPSIYFSDSPRQDLKAYAGDYLQQEIMAEGLTRNLPAFSRFLQTAAQLDGQLIQYTKFHELSGVAKTTAIEYFNILKDTLIAYEVLPWKKSVKRKAIQTAKYYFFDVGVVRFLQDRRRIRKSTPEFGHAFENFIAHELKTFLDYRFFGENLYYWRSTSQFEVDFILQDWLGIEVKACEKVVPFHLKGLKALREEKKIQSLVLVSLDPIARNEGGILLLPYQEFLARLWAGDSFKRL